MIYKNDNGTLRGVANNIPLMMYSSKTAYDNAKTAGTVPNNVLVSINESDTTTQDIEDRVTALEEATIDGDVALTEYTPNLSGDAGAVYQHECYYQKKNGIVQVGVGIAGWNGTVKRTIYTLPSGCRPSRTVRVIGGGNDRIGSCRIVVTTSGEVQIVRNTSTDTGVVDVGCLGVVTYIAG